MAATITATFAGSELGPESRRGQRPSEIIRLQGAASVVGDTLVLNSGIGYRCRNVHRNPQVLGGAFAISSVTPIGDGIHIDLEARIALANQTVWVEIIGDF